MEAGSIQEALEGPTAQKDGREVKLQLVEVNETSYHIDSFFMAGGTRNVEPD